MKTDFSLIGNCKRSRAFAGVAGLLIALGLPLAAPAAQVEIACGNTRNRTLSVARPLMFRMTNSGDCTATLEFFELPSQQGALLLTVAMAAGQSVEINHPSDIAASFRLTATGGGNMAVLQSGPLVANTSPQAAFWARSGDNVYSAVLGDVGIGTMSPAARLDVNGAIAVSGQPIVDPTGQWVGDPTGLQGPPGPQGPSTTDANALFVGSDANADEAGSSLSLGTDGIAALVLLENGFVGIGTPSPGEQLDVRGNVKMGIAGDLYAASGTENLRLLRGSVNTSGVIIAGTGFSASRTSLGNYTVTFTTSFPSVAVPVVTAVSTSATQRIAMVSGFSATAFSVRTFDSAGAAADVAFNFTVMGPQ